jgi:hypothetical protein
MKTGIMHNENNILVCNEFLGLNLGNQCAVILGLEHKEIFTGRNVQVSRGRSA